MNPNGSDASLLNYAQLQNLLRVEFSRARRYAFPLSCLAIQIDRLEHLRDLYGVGTRNQILELVLALVREQSRASDAVAVYGDRLTLVLPHTDLEGATIYARRLQKKVASLGFQVEGRELAVTASIGVSAFEGEGAIFFDALLQGAESALGDALREGANGFRMYRAPSADSPES